MTVLSTLSDPGFGLAEAARVCGVSKPTVRRRKDALVRAGAIADETGWHIPATALVDVGLLDRSPQVPAPREPVSAVRSHSGVTSLPVRSNTPVAGDNEQAARDHRVAELEAELAQVRHQLAAAEARADERDRCLRVLETALAALGDEKPGHRVTAAPVPTERQTPAAGPWRSPATWTHPTGR